LSFLPFQTNRIDACGVQERLEKEKKLSKDLGQAATKLQSLLKVTQEQLTKEQDAVRTLQEHLDGKVRPGGPRLLGTCGVGGVCLLSMGSRCSILAH
jgi:hypothetical protein